MVQVNAQVGFFVDQHAAGGFRRRIEMLVRSDRTTVKGLVHVQGNLFHVNEFLRIMSALHPKEQRELTLFRSKGTGIPDKQNRQAHAV
ncbi:hypothetical protein POZ32_21575 [Bacteroides uniformis]|uniref:Uncharacterized protein n=1 Tax=Bacteroides uniformis TaxID=820 RepID=A0AAW6GL74_BACUN|nr:hypothetical protein [Bacteroides uniformis]MDC1857452.1 hypothetical protein [Bacteroides uniformis]MDC1861821.1 hypothetical protein [Bacteroides uniformis]MDC1874562.1 hypothetical protein [Bacteroides uniformis]